jgi:ABC-type anion transport system duplicated permease subunit
MMMTSRAQRQAQQQQQRGILPTYVGDELSSSSVRRRMGIPSTLPGSLTSIILSPTRTQCILIITILIGLFIGARIAVPQLFHTSSDLVQPVAKADPVSTYHCFAFICSLLLQL